jgi:hypothetical protein
MTISLVSLKSLFRPSLHVNKALGHIYRFEVRHFYIHLLRHFQCNNTLRRKKNVVIGPRADDTYFGMPALLVARPAKMLASPLAE